MLVSESFYREYNNKNYIIVKFKINTLGKNNELNSGIVRLKINKQYYSPNKNICFKFGEKGSCYKRQMITKETNEYIFVYEVKEFDNSKTYIDYSESYEKKYLIKLSPKEY